jgi:phosphatidylglycerophosphate synthase
MFGEKFGHVFDKPLEGFARHIPLSPNTLSLIGFLITVLASFFLVTDLKLGGVFILLGGAFDVLDGVVARVNHKTSKFGAFLDSVLDRYSDALIMLGIAWNLFDKNDYQGVVLCLGAMVGALLISYTRARAEGIGESCSHGLMERPERVVLISFGAITGLMMPVLWIMLVLTHFTVLQRILHVRKATLKG